METTAGMPPVGSSRVVLIGCDRYRHLSDLPAVAANIRDLARALQDPALLGIPEANCKTVTGGPGAELTVPGVIDAVRRAAGTVGRDGLLLVYYAGHGLTDSNGDLHLAVTGSEPGEEDATAVGYDSIRRRVWQSPARYKVVVLDCCYAGSALSGEMSAAALGDRTQIDQSVVIAATGRNRTARSPAGERHTAFTGALLTVLSEGIVGGPPLVDARTLFREVLNFLVSRGLPAPELRSRNAADDVPLVRNTWHPPTRMPGVADDAPRARDARQTRESMPGVTDDAPPARDAQQTREQVPGVADRVSAAPSGPVPGGRSGFETLVTGPSPGGHRTIAEPAHPVRPELGAVLRRLSQRWQEPLLRVLAGITGLVTAVAIMAWRGDSGTPSPERNGSSPAPVPAPSATAAGRPAGAGTCTDAELSVAPVPTDTSPRQGASLAVKLKIKNIGVRTCTRDLGATAQEMYVEQGSQKIWSSDTCGTAGGTEVRSLEPGSERLYQLTWNGQKSSRCSGSAPAGPFPALGTYQLRGRLDTKVSDPVVLTIVS